MIRSANEVMVLASKAARGAGAPPAQASQFGAAVVTYLSMGGSVEALDAALAAVPEGPIMALPLAIARIAESHVDGIASGPFESGDRAMALSYAAALPCQARLSQSGILHLDLNRPALRPEVTRIDLPDETYAGWSSLAASLLVPDSEASRQSGAGAGLSDND